MRRYYYRAGLTSLEASAGLVRSDLVSSGMRVVRGDGILGERSNRGEAAM